MRLLLTLIALFYSIVPLYSQEKMQGAYLSTLNDSKKLWLFVDGYTSVIDFSDTSYLATYGGPYTYDGSHVHIVVEYDDKNPNQVGRTLALAVNVSESEIASEDGLHWEKQAASPQALDGLWKITGRKQNGEVQQIHQSGERKTIKLLVDGYFQWIAIDPSNSGFYGSGGGIYSFENGVYTEKILFFSRDNKRIGATLSFDGALIEGQWHHSGNSSKGDPIYEVWSRPNAKQ